MTNAAREGARIAVLPGYGQPDVVSRVTSFMQNGGVPTTATNPTIVVSTHDDHRERYPMAGHDRRRHLHARLRLYRAASWLVRWLAQFDRPQNAGHDAK